jgi:dolichyl-phosphate-mannose--protein O-mannosyl transferase
MGLLTTLTAGACLLLVPAAIYLAAYIHFFATGHNWGNFVELQRQMWLYHSGLKAPGEYHQSAPWQWVLNLRPVWLYVDYLPDGRIANIYNLGNSVVLYFGLIAAGWAAVRFVRKVRWETGFLLAAYFILWLPWVMSPRIMFSYHYLPATALLCVAGGWVLARWLADRRRALRLLGWIVPAMAVAWFGLFYPNMTAIPVPRRWADAVYFCVPSWR